MHDNPGSDAAGRTFDHRTRLARWRLSTVDIEHATLDRIATATASTLSVPTVAITLLDGNQQRCIGAHGFSREDRSLFSAFCLEVAIANRPVIVQDARSRTSSTARTAWGNELISYAGIPLTLSGLGRNGAIGACAPGRRAWQDRDLAILRAFGDAASAVLELELRLARATIAYASLEARVSELAAETAERERATHHDHRRITLELEQSSFHDELTGLFNRRGLFAVGTVQLENLQVAGERGLVIYLDIDGLKSTNDHLGHGAGDELLRASADVLRQVFLATDTIARIGGDEFVVVTSSTELAGIDRQIATELALYNAHRDPSLHLAWSIGTVETDPNNACVLDQLVTEADRRMYASRHRRHG